MAVEPAPTEANASPGLAETRVAYNPPHEPHLPAEATGHATGKPRWTDWRVYASAGALFAAVALGVRLTRATPSPAVERPVDSTVVTLLPPPPLPTPTLRAGEDIESLRVPPSSGLIAPPAAPPVAVPAPRPVPPPTADTRGNRDLPPPTRGRSSVEDHERAAPPPSALSRLSDTPQEAVAPTPAASAPAESAAQIREAIRSAVNAALSELARTAGAESLLHGDGREAWLALAREGRVSAGAPQALDIAWEGSQATAAFSSDVQVRSPFGANRRHAAQFTAQLQRDGARWRVISLRPAGKLSLK